MDNKNLHDKSDFIITGDGNIISNLSSLRRSEQGELSRKITGAVHTGSGDIKISQDIGLPVINVEGDIIEGNIRVSALDKESISVKIINTIANSKVIGNFREVIRDQRNRRAMLNLVRKFWIEGVLEQSLYGRSLIEVGVEAKSNAVDVRPWDLVLLTPERQEYSLPHRAKIIDVFDEMNQSLLILGEPGSGKTTMLLELARDILSRAEQDPMQPIPVILNLSSWGDKGLPIEKWLVDELNLKYNIPKRVASSWVENIELLLLLDGLDEVTPQYRENCVKAINSYYQMYLSPIVVCSRLGDYETLANRLRLQGAIVLQPLTEEQIDTYLSSISFGHTLRQTINQDVSLKELASSPLMLNIMTLAYSGRESEVAQQSIGLTEDRRTELFNAYVRKMFERRGAAQPYAPQQVTHWLTWLAREMLEHSHTIFEIEQLQPTWLPHAKQRWAYTLSTFAILGLIGFSTFSLLNVINYGASLELNLISIAIFILGLLLGFNSIRKSNLTGIQLSESLLLSWRGVFVGATTGLVLGILTGIFLGVPLGLIYGLISIPTCTLLGGFSRQTVEVKIYPNQGVRQSLQNATLMGSCSLLVTWGIGALILGLSSGLILGLVGGVSVFLWHGGMGALQHFVLRFLLYINGYAPWNYARFLDYAVDRIFLRKVGGSYIFIHRLLLEYFAHR